MEGQPVNLTNNTLRKSWAARKTGPGTTGFSIEKSFSPGPVAAAFDQTGHLVLVMVNTEQSLFGSQALGMLVGGGHGNTPTLRFLRL